MHRPVGHRTGDSGPGADLYRTEGVFMRRESQAALENASLRLRPAPEDPWFVVHERPGGDGCGRLEAHTDLRVAWAAMDPADPEAAPRLFRGLVECLEPGQGVAVTLSSEGDRKGGGVWLRLDAPGGNEGAALAGARELLERVETTVSAFGPVVGVEPARWNGTGGFEWRKRVRPAWVSVRCGGGHGAGFSSSVSSGSFSVTLPVPAGERAPVDALLRALRGLEGKRARAVLKVRRVPAPLAAGPVLERVLDAVAGDAGFVWEGVRWSPGGPVGAAVADAVAALLEAWARSGGDGWALGCSLEADGPLPPGVVSLASKVVFGCQPSGSASPPDRTVDLSGAFPLGTPVPVLLPSPGALVSAGTPRVYPAARVPGANEGVLLGQALSGGAAVPVRLPAGDRSRHVYVVGATGTGKSTLLYNMIVQDIRAGKGVGLLDPHGDLFRQVLAAVPPERAADVVLVDPSDFRFPPGVNLLETSGPFREVQQGFVVNEMIRIFDRLYDLRQTGGPIFEQYMRNALFLALSVRGYVPTLLDVCRIFESTGYRMRLLAASSNPSVASFWREQAERAMGEASLQNLAPYITSKLNQFTHNPILRPIIGQARSTVDLRRVMDEGRILLVNLSKGMLGDLDCRLLGMVLMGKVFQAALGRAAVPQDRRRPFHLFVDEFQNFSTETVSHMLSEARKFGLCLVLANQHLQQLDTYMAPGQSLPGTGGVLPSVLGNVATMVVLRTGPEDAPVLEPFVGPDLSVRDLQELPDFHAVARLLVGSRPCRPFVMRTRPPEPCHSRIACVRAIRRFCRARYARPRRVVRAEILERLEGRFQK